MESYRLERHFKLWEEQNKHIKRVIFLTMVISLALIVKVLDPFVEHSGDKKPIQQRIEALEDEKARVNAQMEVIERTEQKLREVKRFIAAQPWQRDKEELIQRYQQMREGHSRDSYQQEADDTIRNIADTLREKILLPLRQSSAAPDTTRRNLGRMNAEIASLNTFIEEWQNEYIGKRWYDTIQMKEATMSGLTRELNQQLDDFASVVNRELATIRQTRTSVNQELKSLSSEISSESEKLEEIEQELQSVLPKWIHGLVDTYQVIQLLPIALLALSAYVLSIGIGLTRHYETYARGKHFDPSITDEPSMSSVWTLILRGRMGTLQTIAVYALFLAAAWLMLEESMHLLLEWLAMKPLQAWIGAQGPWEAFLWLSRVVFMVLVCYVCTMPWLKSKRWSELKELKGSN